MVNCLVELNCVVIHLKDLNRVLYGGLGGMEGKCGRCGGLFVCCGVGGGALDECIVVGRSDGWKPGCHDEGQLIGVNKCGSWV